jgi:hypothetical protein
MMERRTWSPPSPSADQQVAIHRAIANFEANPEVELLGWQVIDPAEFLREGEEADGIYVEFRYRHVEEDPALSLLLPGREVIVLAAVGSVLDSQDFG